MMDPKLREHLQKPFAPEEVDRWWGTIEGRLPPGRAPSVALRPALVLALAGAAALALAVTTWRSAPASSPLPVTTVAPTAGPLHLEGEAAPLAEFATNPGEFHARFSDHSEIRAAGPASLRLLENSGTRFEVKQLRGRVHYEVTPGGPRRWSVDCSLATIEVVGTAFWVEAEERRVKVRVEHGVVLVKGERVPERVQRLAAGESIEISAEQPPAPASAAPSASAAPARSPTAASAASAEPPRWRELARQGAFREAYAQLGPGGVSGAAAQASTDELFALADVARHSGHPREAVAPLEKIAGRGGAQGALAAFTLGRIRLDQLGDPGGAVQEFDRALALGLGGGLRDDAAVRRVEALGRSGQRAQAAEAARTLAERQPSLKGRVAAWLPE
jgi:transmembrane sensor